MPDEWKEIELEGKIILQDKTEKRKINQGGREARTHLPWAISGIRKRKPRTRKTKASYFC